MKKQNAKKQVSIKRLRSTPVLVLLSCLTLIIAGVAGGFNALAASCSSTTDCQQQISSNASSVSNSEQSLGALSQQASSYESAISQLQSQISGLQGQISTNQNTQVSLQSQITQGQVELAQQKSTLASDLQALYVSGQITPIEMLATSDSISQYVDQQEAYSAIQDKIQSTLQQINTLESKLQAQKIQVTNLISTLQAQQSQLSSAESQQASLLSYNQSQQAQYNQQITAANSNISQLKAQLTALNDAGGSRIISGSTCGGGYPTSTPNSQGNMWGCDHAQDNTNDNWGMLNRECVSYTAFMVHEEYLQGKVAHDMPNWGGEGNAYQWISDAESAGIPVSQTPEPGDIAIRSKDWSDPGDVGHAMYVISVQSPTDITVGEYNEHYNGTYDEREVNTNNYAAQGTPVYYLHFEQWQ